LAGRPIFSLDHANGPLCETPAIEPLDSALDSFYRQSAPLVGMSDLPHRFRGQIIIGPVSTPEMRKADLTDHYSCSRFKDQKRAKAEHRPVPNKPEESRPRLLAIKRRRVSRIGWITTP
jgi:hypothetical protein